jgi:hypothetical protein
MRTLTIIMILLLLAVQVSAQRAGSGVVVATIKDSDGAQHTLTLEVDTKDGQLSLSGLRQGWAIFVVGTPLSELQYLNPSLNRLRGKSTDLFLTLVIPTPNPNRPKGPEHPLSMKESKLPWDRIQTRLDHTKLIIEAGPDLLEPSFGTFRVGPDKADRLLGNLSPEDELTVFYVRIVML